MEVRSRREKEEIGSAEPATLGRLSLKSCQLRTPKTTLKPVEFVGNVLFLVQNCPIMLVRAGKTDEKTFTVFMHAKHGYPLLSANWIIFVKTLVFPGLFGHSNGTL